MLEQHSIQTFSPGLGHARIAVAASKVVALKSSSCNLWPMIQAMYT